MSPDKNNWAQKTALKVVGEGGMNMERLSRQVKLAVDTLNKRQGSSPTSSSSSSSSSLSTVGVERLPEGPASRPQSDTDTRRN